MSNSKMVMSQAANSLALTAGQTLFYGRPDGASTAVDSFSFVVPDGVTEISAVCVGPGQSGRRNDSTANGGAGGNLRYSSSIAVTAGETLTVEVGEGIQANTSVQSGGTTRIKRGATILLEASNQTNSTDNSTIGGSIGGGDGGIGGGSTSTNAGGGGGAGGYSGSGGAGQTGGGTTVAPAANSGGAFGGIRSASTAGPGGGVGLMGAGPTGSDYYSSTSQNARNAVGSYGFISDGSIYAAGFGSGGGGNDSTSGFAGAGGAGACRIVWGAGRSYPNNVDNYLPLASPASQIELRLYGSTGCGLSMLSVKDANNTDFFSGLTPVEGGSSSSFSSISSGQFTLKAQAYPAGQLSNLKSTNTAGTYIYYSPTGLANPSDYVSIFIKPTSAKIVGSITLSSAYNSASSGPYNNPVSGIAVIADGLDITKGIACLRGDYVWDGTYERLIQTITFT